MNNDDELIKIAAFNRSMEKYLNNPVYNKIHLINSCLVITLQIVSFLDLLAMFQPTKPFIITVVFISSYICADFINGIVHMYMDNNTNYHSILGPFITAFHMHHARPKYKNRQSLQVYFFESGSKFWLTGYLILLILIQQQFYLPFSLNLGLVSFAIWSSLAEVSHYWCHTASAKNTFILRLQKYHILLSKKHHSSHHKSDNNQYAFLNGISDPLLDRISQYFYKGYKNNADKHTQAYLKIMKHSAHEK